jgi:hypothetical protein
VGVCVEFEEELRERERERERVGLRKKEDSSVN